MYTQLIRLPAEANVTSILRDYYEHILQAPSTDTEYVCPYSVYCIYIMPSVVNKHHYKLDTPAVLKVGCIDLL